MVLQKNGIEIFSSRTPSGGGFLRGIKATISREPRFAQIGSLLAMLSFGVWGRDFNVGPWTVLYVVGTAAVAQTFLILLWKLPFNSFLSAGISALSMLLLCRSNSLIVLAGATALAILSKLVFRWRGKHFFNPTNFGILAALLITNDVWISPAQWGEEIVVLLWIVMMGLVVISGARRYDISFAFLVTYVGLLYWRVNYLGQPLPVFLHQLNSGSLIIFTFFMISDPRSTPNHPIGRILFAVSVAGLAYYFRFKLFNSQGLLLALFILSPLTVLIDGIFKARRFEWNKGTKEIAYAPNLVASPI